MQHSVLQVRQEGVFIDQSVKRVLHETQEVLEISGVVDGIEN